MVSSIRFIKLMPSKWGIAYMWPQLILLVASIVSVIFLGVAAIPAVFALYVLLSLIYKHPNQVNNKEATA
jgi:phosphatidylserine synthase